MSRHPRARWFVLALGLAVVGATTLLARDQQPANPKPLELDDLGKLVSIVHTPAGIDPRPP